MTYLLRLRLYLRDRTFIRSAALFSMVRESPWYVMYKDGQDSDLIAAISLSRGSFEYLLSRFKDVYKFKSGPNRKGRSPRVKDHHCVLSMLLHSYCSPADRKTWSEMFGVSASTLSRTLLKAEVALLHALNATKEADVIWPSKDDQIRMALLVERKVSTTNIIDSLLILQFSSRTSSFTARSHWSKDGGASYVQEPGEAFLQNSMYNE